MSCLEAQTQIAVARLTSAPAKQSIEKLPSIETLMPVLSFAEVADEAESPAAEQLVSPLQQRRHRERQAAFHNGGQALQVASPNVADGDGEAIP
jgi:hypothetical protein